MSLFSNLSKTAKIMILSVIAVCIILLIVGLIILNLIEYYNVFGDKFEVEKNLPFAIGLMLGGVSSIIKVILIERALNRTLDIEDEQQAKNMGQMFYMGRFIFSFAVLLVGVLVKFFGFFGTILGVFSLRVAAHITSVIEAKNKNNNIKNESEER